MHRLLICCSSDRILMVHSFLTVCFLSWKVKPTLALLNCYCSLKLFMFLEFVLTQKQLLYCYGVCCRSLGGWKASEHPSLAAAQLQLGGIFSLYFRQNKSGPSGGKNLGLQKPSPLLWYKAEESVSFVSPVLGLCVHPMPLCCGIYLSAL